MVGVDQRQRLLAREPLDAERARQADQRAVEPVSLHELGAPRRRLGGGVDHVRALAREVEHLQTALGRYEREVAAVGERVEERLGPQVLMYVDSHSYLS